MTVETVKRIADVAVMFLTCVSGSLLLGAVLCALSTWPNGPDAHSIAIVGWWLFGGAAAGLSISATYAYARVN